MMQNGTGSPFPDSPSPLYSQRMTSEPCVSGEEMNLHAVRPAAEEDEKVEVRRLQLHVRH